jgi:hypothetical protein
MNWIIGFAWVGFALFATAVEQDPMLVISLCVIANIWFAAGYNRK